MRVIRKILSKNIICIISFIVYYSLAIISSLKGHPWSPIDFASGVVAMAVAFKVRNKK